MDSSVPEEERPLSVLVVDDEEGVRSLLRRWLERWHFTVRTAGSATDALALMIAHPSDIVLCDIRMPGRDGVWLVEKLTEAWPTTVFVMTSGVSDADVIERVRRLGAVDFVPKPVGRESFREAMDRAVKACGR